MQLYWVWFNDLLFDWMFDGCLYLVDVDFGKMLGMVSGGYGYLILMIVFDGCMFVLLLIFYMCGMCGICIDVVMFYVIKDFVLGFEIEILVKCFNGMLFFVLVLVMLGGCFGMIYNFMFV